MRNSRATHPPRARLTAALAVALAVAALLSFAWPLEREPRLHVVLAFIHVLAAWAVVVGVLAWLSRLRMPEDPGGEGRDA